MQLHDQSTPTSVALEDLRAQFGPGYARYAADYERHLALLNQLRRPDEVLLTSEASGPGQWRVTICATDCLGVLSIIAGLFTASRVDIVSADIYTLHLPEPAPERAPVRRPWQRRPLAKATPKPPTRRLLDIFDVRAPAEAGSDFWAARQAELTHLVNLLTTGRVDEARDAIVDRVATVFEATDSTDATLFPIAIDVVNEPGADLTRLTVNSGDTTGFLFAFTNALAGFTINIERAEIRTIDGEAVDTLWVTDMDGRTISGEQRIHELRAATTLIKQFTHLLPRSPNPGLALRQFNALIVQMLSRPQWTAELTNLESFAVLETLAELMGVSRFLWEDFLRMQHESLFPVLVDVPGLHDRRGAAELRASLASALATSGDPVAALNAFRDREMFRIDLRHITAASDFVQFSEELCDLAAVTVAAGADICHDELRAALGQPRLADGSPCAWAICALGKFGGRELGFGSDLELVFVYEDDGSTDGNPPVPNSGYFTRFVQRLLSILATKREGIFEIDLRLRPHGKGGSLACTADGFHRYYVGSQVAEQFERMALVRLRPVAGNAALGRRLEASRDAFVYADRPLDLANVRHLRHRQATELVAPGQVNAKYSVGALVDVEYYAQAWQIAVGGHDPAVRVTNTLAALNALARQGHLPVTTAIELAGAYAFLRRLIDALRVVRGHAKDLTIPPADSREFAYLAHRLHFVEAAQLQEAIAKNMGYARDVWDQLPPPS